MGLEVLMGLIRKIEEKTVSVHPLDEFAWLT